MEHLYDPLLALKQMGLALNPGGMQMHKIDLRDHTMFSTNFHELKFLVPGDFLYKNMTAAAGRPNRVLIHEYRRCLDEMGHNYTLLVTRLAGVGEIKPHIQYLQIDENIRKRSIQYIQSVRNKFADKFSHVSDEDLCIAGVFVIACTPG